jgi:hypothetical protein
MVFNTGGVFDHDQVAAWRGLGPTLASEALKGQQLLRRTGFLTRPDQLENPSYAGSCF